MNYFLIQSILIAEIGNEDNSFWIQILVFLFVAVAFGLYSYTKNNRSKHKDHQQDFPGQARPHRAESRWRFHLPHKPFAPQKGIVQEYIAKMKKTRHHDHDIDHAPSLSQEPKVDFDSPAPADRKIPKSKPAAEKNKNLCGGMDLLELDFLLSTVENIKGNDKNDVTMRKLNFNEVIRREKLSKVKSKALKIYAINGGNLYDKDIQCRAMGELAERTTRTNSPQAPQPAVYPKKIEKMADVK